MNLRPLKPAALAATFALLLTGTAHANIYMDLPGATGSATARGHEGWIELGSVQWGVGVAASLNQSLAGGSRAWELSRPSFSDIVWTQQADISVPGLMNKMFTRSITGQSTIDLTRSGAKEGELTYLQLVTQQVAVTGVSLSNGSVSASQAYSKISMSYESLQDGKDKGSKIVAEYDLASGKASISGAPAASAAGGGKTVSPGIYMRLGSGAEAIAGEVSADPYRNWVRIDSAQLGVGAAYNLASGSVSMPSFSEIAITQAFDQTTPVVFNGLVTGRNIGEVVIDYVAPYGARDESAAYMRLVFEDVVFTGLSLSSGGDLPYVSESMSFSKMSQTVWEIDGKGGASSFSSYGYDLRTQKVIAGGLQPSSVSGFGAGLAPSMAAGAEIPPTVPAPVPEPQTALMLLAGLGVLAAAARRRLPA